MREKKEHTGDRDPHGPSESGILPASEAGETERPRAAKFTVEPAKVPSTRSWGTRLIVYPVAALVLLLAVLAVPRPAHGQVAIGISVNFGPPALPYYDQPPCPAPGYVWTPGYWAYDPDYGYYWVPGTWVPAPFIGAMWTPGYWGWNDGVYSWYPGYWGPVVGYYGGINYGYGYTGYGYEGGYWRHDRFYYNRVVNNINTTNITYVYNQPVRSYTTTRVAYNGGPGGVQVRPTPQQLAAARERRFGPTDRQRTQEVAARSDPAQRASVNRGIPAVAATPRPGEFHAPHVVRASRAGAPYHPPSAAPVERRNNAPSRMSNPGRNEAAPRGVSPRNERTVPNREMNPRNEAAPRGVTPRNEPAPNRGYNPGRNERSVPNREYNPPPRNEKRAPEAAPRREGPPANMERRAPVERPQPERRPEAPPRERGGSDNGHGPGGRFR